MEAQGDGKARPPNGWSEWFIAGLVALVALAILGVLPRFAPKASHGVGGAAPPFALAVVANGDPGARMALADLKGQAVLIDFWASWCGPCTMQAPIVDRIGKKYEAKGLRVVGINVDDTADVAKAHTRKLGVSYPILLDETSDAQRAYGVSRLPSLVVVDREGNVSSFTSGIVDEDALDRMVREAL